MSNGEQWAAPGVDCQCLRDGPWFAASDLLSFLIFGPDIIPGPYFMEVLKIKSLDFLASDAPGHRVKLRFDKYPGHAYCICQFVPVQKIENEKEDEIEMNFPKQKEFT